MKTIDRELLETLKEKYTKELQSLKMDWVGSDMSYELYAMDTNYLKGKLDLIEELLKD